MVTSPALHVRGPADTFVESGYAYVPTDAQLLSDTQAAMQELISLCQTEAESWALTRPGESRPDVGLIDTRSEPGKDHKFFFHYAPDLLSIAHLSGRSISPEIAEYLEILRKGFGRIKFDTLAFASGLEDHRGRLVRPGFTARLAEACKWSKPYCTSALRGLWYPNVPEQTGAQVHGDRSTLTAHGGDFGGKLFGLLGESKERIEISPEPGQLLIFPGVKMLYETNGRIDPLLHGSTTEIGRDREALVFFAHTDVGYTVEAWRSARDHFWNQVYQR